MEILAIGVVSLAIMLIGLVLGLILTIIQGLPLYKIAKATGVPHAWLSFFPVGNTYIVLSVPKFHFQFLGMHFERKGLIWKVMILAVVVGFFVGLLGDVKLIGALVGFIGGAFSFLLSYKIYLDFYVACGLGNERLFAVLSALIPVVFMICVFMCASKFTLIHEQAKYMN